MPDLFLAKLTSRTIRDELVSEAKKMDLDSEHLDEVVHLLKSDEASRVNNDGLSRQIEYMLTCGSPIWVYKELQRLSSELKEENKPCSNELP